MIVNEEQLLRYEDSVMTSNPNCFAVDELQEHEKEILRQRMLSYRDQVDDLKQTEQLGLVVVSVAGETYGLVLSDIKELMNQSDLVSIPCCPPHILGNMNLRGDIVTLIDISGILGFSRSNEQQSRQQALKKVIVYQFQEQLLGIGFDRIQSIIYIEPSSLKAVPAALKDDDYIMGEVLFEEKMITLLDIYKILNREELIVDESV